MSRPLADSVAAPQLDKAKLPIGGFARQRVAAIARNAFREAVRDRVLYNLVVFALLLIAGAIFLGELSGGQEAKILVDLGLSAILLFGVLIAIFVGVGLVYKELERRTLYAILSKPIGRGEFLLGKYLGLSLTLLVHPYLAGNLTDLCRADNSYGCSDVVLVFLVTSAFGIVELLRFCDRAFQL